MAMTFEKKRIPAGKILQTDAQRTRKTMRYLLLNTFVGTLHTVTHYRLELGLYKSVNWAKCSVIPKNRVTVVL